MKNRNLMIVILLTSLSIFASAQNIATLRDAPLDIEPQSDKMARVENKDMKRKRAYPMQPPTIPHKIDGYQIDTNSNKCLSCHSRKQSENSQAPMISVTHYQDREGNFLADVSPRRYFCEQCHVTQQDIEPKLDNEFVDIDELLRANRDK
jgi:cytochrome c-type protein NapB